MTLAPARVTLLALIIGLLLAAAAAPAAAQFKARDKTVGACTRKDEFAKRQAQLDPLVQELSRADEAARPKLGQQIARKHGRGQRIENLIRYREPVMKHVFVPLLQEKQWPIRARALYGLKMTGDASVMPAVVKRLKDKTPQVREMAANCLGRLCLGHSGVGQQGSEEAVTAMRAAAEKEKDRFVRASLEAAIALAGESKPPYRDWAEQLVGPEGAKRVAWEWTVKGKRSFTEYDARTAEGPEAPAFDWPISWYHDSLFMKMPRRTFGGSSGHAGEDIAWFREGASVYAAADGLVRLVQGAGGDWGFLVVIEHKPADGNYVCSVHGHLSWDLLVKPGDTVKRGQKIASVGLSCATENGGYGAHLHFGIADGPFRKPRNIFRDGSALNFDYKGKRVKAPVIGYAYLPKKKDKNGFPGIGVRCKVPDGEVLTMAVGNVPLAHQVGWIAGNAKGCRGWLEPKKFIEARLAAEAQ